MELEINVLQLELDLWEQIKQAEAAPTAIAFSQLCLCFDQELERMSPKEKLEQGAEAIRQLADLLAMRADAYFEEFQQKFDPTGPTLNDDDFSDLIRQSFSLEMEDFIEEPEPTYRLPNETNFKTSLVSEISKDDLIELLEDSQVNSQSLDVEKLEYDEAVSDWIAVVRKWLEAMPEGRSSSIGRGQAELLQVVEETAMSPVMVWMALLLGGFELRKEGDFYTGDVLVG